MEYDQGLATLESRAKVATAVLWLFVAIAVPTALAQVLEGTGTVNIAADTGPLALAVGLAYIAFPLIFVAAVIVVAMWIHRAHANLRDAGVDGLEFTPGWAVGWYFIPFANLIKPFEAMRELWNASHGRADLFGGTAPPLLKVWWAVWIIGNIASNVGAQIMEMEGGGPSAVTTGLAIGSVGTGSLLLAALLLIKMIHGVTQAQRGGVTAVGVFA